MATWQSGDYYGEENRQPGDLAGGAYISAGRIIGLSVVSLGIYWLYWMYRTWKQYRDHTAFVVGDSGQIHYPVPRVLSEPLPIHYPVWHGLTQLVPIYGFYRFHAHIRSYKELMLGRGVPDTLNLRALTIIVVVISIVGLIAGLLRGSDEVSLAVRLIALVVQVAIIAVEVGVMCRVQSNINAYWADVDSRLMQSARFGKGEIVCIVLGVLFWLGTGAGIIWPT